MAHFIQLEAYTGGGDIFCEIWINADQIVSMLSQPPPKGTRIYLTEPVSVVETHAEKMWIDVRQSPEQIREKVVAERAMKRDG